MPNFNLKYDPQTAGPQYLEDLATGYWFSQVLFTAVEKEIFDLLGSEGQTSALLAKYLTWDCQSTERFLQALVTLGLLTSDGGHFFNTKLASDCLVRGSVHYQGDSILWRRNLTANWGDLEQCLRAGGRVSYPPDDDPQGMADQIRSYIRAMDDVASCKVEEILPIFDTCGDRLGCGQILDIGAGSGAISAAFLEHFPGCRATLVDLPAVLEVTRELLQERECSQRLAYLPVNILEQWSLPAESYDLVILSNIVHAYSQVEITAILKQAAGVLSPCGYLLIHDFFPEHCSAKASLLDLNMLINTYNGRIFPATWVEEQLRELQLTTTGLLPLKSDTAVLIAAHDQVILETLNLDARTRLMAQVRALGFADVHPLTPAGIKVADWAPLRCQFGCNLYGKRHCPPNSPTPDLTRKVLQDFEYALLLVGEPPSGDFQRLVLKAEQLAFKTGFYKAFAFWAGPCALCADCAKDAGEQCRHPKQGRPSMEGAGIDVFETVHRAGLALKTLKDRGEYVRYFALLLVE